MIAKVSSSEVIAATSYMDGCPAAEGMATSMEVTGGVLGGRDLLSVMCDMVVMSGDMAMEEAGDTAVKMKSSLKPKSG